MKRRVCGATRIVWLVVFASALSIWVLLGKFDVGPSHRRMRHRTHWREMELSPESHEDSQMREWEYKRALQYEGTGGRMQAFLKKAMSGEPFTVSVIGGSVSKGRGLNPVSRTQGKKRSVEAMNVLDRAGSHGLDPLSHLGASTLYSPENMHSVIFEYLNSTFPHPGNKFINGAQGGVGSSYFGWCFKEHIPEDSDLVLLELGINDLQFMDVIESFEHLVRGVLELKSQPAILNIETFTTLFPTLLTSASLHLDVLTYYDVPSISIRDVLMPRILLDPHGQLPRWFRTGGDVELGDSKVEEWGGKPVDLMHISKLGHGLAAGLSLRYIMEQYENLLEHPPSLVPWGRWSASTMRRSKLQILEVPSVGLTTKFDPLVKASTRNPQCRSMNSAILHSSISGDIEDPSTAGIRGLQPKEGSSGWTPWSWKEKRYLMARTPGSIFSIDFITLSNSTTASKHPHHYRSLPDETQITKRQFAGGTASVHIGYQRSPILGLGSVECWVDDSPFRKRVDGYWDLKARNMGAVTEIASDLEAGLHTLHCELLKETADPSGGKEFRLFAIMHD